MIKLATLGRVKGQISLNFNYKVNFNDFYMFSQMKDIKHIEQNFHSVAWFTLQGVGPLGNWEWKASKNIA